MMLEGTSRMQAARTRGFAGATVIEEMLPYQTQIATHWTLAYASTLKP
jgi:hypothetical protein